MVADQFLHGGRRPAAAALHDELVPGKSVELSSHFLRHYHNYLLLLRNSTGNHYTNDPNGLGLTNIPFFGMTNQIPAFGITNIPVLINGNFVYSPAVNRLLQLAANIYDATTNRYYDNLQPPTPLPTVFRPIFNVTNDLNFNGVRGRTFISAGLAS